MYTDPALTRDHVVKLSLADWEWDMVEAFAAADGVEVDEWLREAMLDQANVELAMDGLS